MEIDQELSDLKALMEEMLELAKQGKWDDLIKKDKERSNKINKISSLTDNSMTPQQYIMIDAILAIDKSIMEVCISRKDDLMNSLSDAGKAVKCMKEYMKNI